VLSAPSESAILLKQGRRRAPSPPPPAAAADVARRLPAWAGLAGVSGSGDKLGPPIIVAERRRAWFAARMGAPACYDGGFAPSLGASARGLRKVELTGATFLSAFGFLPSRLPRCLSPMPMIVHPTLVLHTARCSSCGAAWHPAVPAH